jgi:membrane fusion protein (multidrug efflux system)
MWVDFPLPERYLGRVGAGQSVQVQVDALGSRRFDGRIEALDARVEADGRSLLVRARLDDPAGMLKAGMFARVRTVLAVRDDALVVPEEALVPQAGRQYLVKVVDGPKGKVSQRLEARTGVREGGRVEILQGLSEGDLVVVAGQDRAMRADGTLLRIVRVGGETGGVQERPVAPAPAAAAARGARRAAPAAGAPA